MTKEELERIVTTFPYKIEASDRPPAIREINLTKSHLEANAEIEHLNTVIIKTLENTIIRLTSEFEAEIEKLKAEVERLQKKENIFNTILREAYEHQYEPLLRLHIQKSLEAITALDGKKEE